MYKLIARNEILQRRSENHRLFFRYLSSRLRQLCTVWNISEKHSIVCSECRTPWRESFSVLQRPSSVTLSICCVICILHWLPVEYRIKFKLAKLAFNTRNNSAPLYLTCLVHDYVPGRSLPVLSV